MPKVEDINKRKSKRYSCAVPVDSQTGSSFDHMQTVDISRDGVGFVCDHEVPINEKIAVEISLTPDSDPVLVMGVVRWARQLSDSDQYRVGMTFSEVISGSRNGLKSSLENRFSFDEENF